jgi:hypothetical protein
MLKKLVLVFVVLAALLVSANVAFGLQFPATLYVDLAYVGSEDGSQAKPYNNIDEATAIAQNMPYGADIYQKQADGSWKFLKTVNPVHAGQTGTPLARPVLFGILVAFSLLLIVLGLRLRRQSRALAR